MLAPVSTQQLDSSLLRKEFIERMERKLAYKTAARRRRRQAFRTRLIRLRSWQ